MSTLTWKTERELQQEIKTAETNLVGRKTWTFYGGGEKMRNANGHQGENEQQWKKKWTETHTTFPALNV